MLLTHIDLVQVPPILPEGKDPAWKGLQQDLQLMNLKDAGMPTPIVTCCRSDKILLDIAGGMVLIGAMGSTVDLDTQAFLQLLEKYQVGQPLYGFLNWLFRV